MRFSFCRPSRRAAAIASAIVFALWAGAGWRPAAAAGGPFAEFHGSWSGTGTMRSNGKTERIRCDASYRAVGSSGHEIDLTLKCDSDTYKFDLGGRFRADEGNHVSGQWTEHTRNVGGIVIGNVNGSALSAARRKQRLHRRHDHPHPQPPQSVSIYAQGGGQIVKSSLTLHRR